MEISGKPIESYWSGLWKQDLTSFRSKCSTVLRVPSADRKACFKCQISTKNVGKVLGFVCWQKE